VAVTPRRNGFLLKATRASPPRWNFSSRRDRLHGSGTRFYQAGKKATAVLVSRRTETRELQRIFTNFPGGTPGAWRCAGIATVWLSLGGEPGQHRIGQKEVP
jgi:hypothetical protein